MEWLALVPLCIAIVILGWVACSLQNRVERMERIFARMAAHWPVPYIHSANEAGKCYFIEDLDTENWGNLTQEERDRIRMRMPND